jgi:hypothetical protein
MDFYYRHIYIKSRKVFNYSIKADIASLSIAELHKGYAELRGEFPVKPCAAFVIA